MKHCKACGITKELTEFYNNKTKTDGKASQCKQCSLNYRSSTYKKSNRKYTIKRDYGITLNEYEERMKTSDCCEICGSVDRLCYDHCHETMEFRGVLCRKCNMGIGLLGDTEQRIAKALKYLKREK